MASIGEQIIAARKAKGMTQDTLSKALNISRSAVAHWETGRTIPDAEMLLRLSKVLEYSFEEEAAKAAETASQAEAPSSEDDDTHVRDTVEPCKADHTDHSKSGTTKSKQRRWIAVCAAATVVLCVCLALLFIHNNRIKPAQYKDEDGKPYTIEQFKQETPREDGKAWLSREQVVKIQQGDGFDVWMYEFIFHEMNGIGATIDRLETYVFVDGKVHPQIISGKALSSYGIENAISPHGDWSFSGGMPVQEKVAGVGVSLTITDDNGESLTFTNYIKLNS